MIKQNSKNGFYNVVMAKEDYDSYIEWANLFQSTYKTRFHKGYLSQLFKSGSHSIDELKLLQTQHTHTKKNMHIGILHRKIINHINQKWMFEQIEDKSTFKITNNDLIILIKEIFQLKDRRPINDRRDEILELLELQTIQEGKTLFITHKTYVRKINIKEIQESQKEDNLINAINRIIQKGKEGLEDAILYKTFNIDMSKDLEHFKILCTENKIIKYRTKYYIKSFVDEKLKQEAEKEVDEILAL